MRLLPVGRTAVRKPAPTGKMEKDYLTLKHVSASRPSGDWNNDDYDVLAAGAVVGRILRVHAAPVGTPWMWTLAYGDHEDRTPMPMQSRRASPRPCAGVRDRADV
jgi:hypothetical protein